MTQQVAKAKPIDTVRAQLEKMAPQMRKALPAHLPPDRMLRITMTAIQNTPKILECDRRSLFSAIMTAAQLGLEPDGVLGQGYLVPFKRRVIFIPGYRGLLSLARNSGEISTIAAHEVCVRDDFDFAYGLNERLDHRPAEGDRGEIKYVYAYARMKDGGYVFEVLTKAEVDKIRDGSEGYKAFKAGHIKSTPWHDHYVQMARKTAIRRLAQYLPLSVQKAVAIEDAYDRGAHAEADEYGDITIEGEATEVTDDNGNGNGAKTKAVEKLDELAGEDDTQEEKAPQKAQNGRKKGKEKQPEKFPLRDEAGVSLGLKTAEEWLENYNQHGQKLLESGAEISKFQELNAEIYEHLTGHDAQTGEIVDGN